MSSVASRRRRRWVAAVWIASVGLAGAIGLTATPASAATASWSGDTLLGSGLDRNVTDDTPAIHVSTSGAAVVTWKSTGGAFVATKGATGPWSAPRRLIAPNRGGSVWSGIGGGGRAVVLWTADGSTVYWAQHFPSGVWSATKQLPVPLHPGSFDMSMSGLGVVSYVSKGHPYVKVLDAHGVWRPAVELSTAKPASGQGATETQAVIADNGVVTATWFWITASGAGGVSGDADLGGTDAAGHPVAVTTLERSAIAGPRQLSKSTDGAAVALLTQDETLCFRLRGGPLRHKVVPRFGAVSVPVTFALADDAVTLWYYGSQPTPGFTLYRSDFTGGTWSTPTTQWRQPKTPFDMMGLSSAAAASERLLGFTIGTPSNSHVAHVTRFEDENSNGGQEYVLGANSTVATVSAAGTHAALAWVGGPNGSGLRVRTR